MDESLGQLIVEIAADISKLQAGLAQAQQSVSGFAQESGNTSNSVKNSWAQSLQTVGSNLEQFASHIRVIGREFTQLASIVALAGTAMIAPFVLALHDSSKSVMAVGDSLQRLTDIGQAFYESIAQSVLPVVDKFSKSLNGLLHWFLALPQPMRDAIAQGVFLNGIMLLITAAVLKFSGETIHFIRDIAGISGRFLEWIGVMAATNPAILAIGAAIIVLTALMIKFKAVGDTVMTGFEYVWRALWTGILTVKIAFEQALKVIANGILNVVTLLAKIPGPSQKAFQGMIADVNGVRRALNTMQSQDMQGVVVQSQKMGQILTTGTSDWAKSFDVLKNTITGFFKAFQDGSNQYIASHKTMQSVTLGSINALQTLGTSLTNAATQNKKFATAAKIVSLALAIINTATGVTKALSDYPWPISLGIAAVVGAAGAIQIGTIASQQFAEGTDTVPAMLSPGEMVIPNTFAGAIRSGSLTLGGPSGSGGQSGAGLSPNIYITVAATVNQDVDISSLSTKLGTYIEQYLRRIK